MGPQGIQGERGPPGADATAPFSARTFMDAAWLNTHAELGEPPRFDAGADRLDFFDGSVLGARVLRVPLAAPGAIAGAATVTFTVAWTPVSADTDPRWVICSPTDCVGFEMQDGNDQAVQMLSMAPADAQRSFQVDEALQGSFGRQALFEGQVRVGPDGAWGAAWGRDGPAGVIATDFSRAPDPSQGLWLELYRGNESEAYSLHWIAVDLREEPPR